MNQRHKPVCRIRWSLYYSVSQNILGHTNGKSGISVGHHVSYLLVILQVNTSITVDGTHYMTSGRQFLAGV